MDSFQSAAVAGFPAVAGWPHSYLNMLVPIAAAALALSAALSGYVMVKFYGVIFLGQPREENWRRKRTTSDWKRMGLTWLALGCILLEYSRCFILHHRLRDPDAARADAGQHRRTDRLDVAHPDPAANVPATIH